MASTETWTSKLPPCVTLRVFNGDTLVFSSGGKWLMPIFELETFMETYFGSLDDLRAHDTAIGKAAAVMMVRLGVKHIHANIVSDLAQKYIEQLNDGMLQYVNRAGQTCSLQAPDVQKIELVYDTKVPKLLCATEDELALMTDSGAMYRILRRRANLTDSAEAENLSCKYSFRN
jgi:hypothetical protein